MPSLPPSRLAHLKAQARLGNRDDFELLTMHIGTLPRPDQLEILRIYLDHLQSSTPPSLSDLKTILNENDHPLVMRCHLSRLSILGLQQVFFNDDKWGQDRESEVITRHLWRYIWPWIRDLYFADNSSLRPQLVAVFWYPNQPELTRLLATLVGQITCITTDTDQFHRILGNCDGLAPFVAKMWFDSVTHPVKETTLSWIASKTLSRLTGMPRPGWMAEILDVVGGSPADFAACALAHIRRTMQQDFVSLDLVNDSMMVILSPLTPELHEQLVSQGSIQLVQDVIQFFLDAPPSSDNMPTLGYFTAFEYLINAFSTSPRSPDLVTTALNNGLLVAMMKTSVPGVAVPNTTHFARLVRLLKVVQKYLVYRAALKPVAKSLHILSELKINPTKSGDAEVSEAWKSFKASAKEKLTAKAGLILTARCTKCRLAAERTRFQQCSRCHAYYCSKNCQELDWKHGNHRSTCIPQDTISDKQYQFLTFLACRKMQEFSRELSLLYQKYILSYMSRAPLPPIAVVFDMTSHPPLIKAGHPDDYLLPMGRVFGQDWVRRMRNGIFGNPHPGQIMVVFAEIPMGDTTAHIHIQAAADCQPAIPFATWPEFLRSRRVRPEREVDATMEAVERLNQELTKVRLAGKVAMGWISENAPTAGPATPQSDLSDGGELERVDVD